MIERPCIIIIDRPSAFTREAIHSLIKEKSDGWWHHYPDIWIAGGLGPQEWRNILQEEAPGRTLVMALPQSSKERNWAFSWQENQDSSDSLGGPAAWLAFVYSGRDLDLGGSVRAIEPAKSQEDDSFSDEPPF